jgi:hypothetical protein
VNLVERSQDLCFRESGIIGHSGTCHFGCGCRVCSGIDERVSGLADLFSQFEAHLHQNITVLLLRALPGIP